MKDAVKAAGAGSSRCDKRCFMGQEDGAPGCAVTLGQARSTDILFTEGNRANECAPCGNMESQNDLGVERNLKGHLIPIPCHGQGQYSTRKVAPNPVQSGLGLFQGCGINNKPTLVQGAVGSSVWKAGMPGVKTSVEMPMSLK